MAFFRRSVASLSNHWIFIHLSILLIFAPLVPCSAQVQTGGPKNSSQPVPMLDVVQIAPTVRVPSSAEKCTVNLMQHTFGDSYGKPFIGDYKPPGCQFNHVVMTFTATSFGRQFDRLALMYFNDTEVWRTSTAEPTSNGIIWTYVKDMSHYLSLWKEPQKLIFDLGNLIDDKYTGSFNTTLTATYFDKETSQPPADIVFPVSKRLGSKNEASAFRVPDDGQAVSHFTIPQNAKKAIFSISACGQADEEFWWSNVPQSAISIIPNVTMTGYSPFRELQLWVDKDLAGVAWPFPIIFTGGIVPQFWRPLVGIDAFDMKEDEIDITPWIPLLSDGKDHSYEIKVVGIEDDGSGKFSLSKVASNWVITGKLFLWLDKAGSITRGDAPKVSSPPLAGLLTITPEQDTDGTVSGFDYSVLAIRNFSVEGSIITSEGIQPSGWNQILGFENNGTVEAGGLNQTNHQRTLGRGISTSGYSREFEYLLNVNSSTKVDKATNEMYLDGKFQCGKFTSIHSQAVFPTGQDDFDSRGEPVALGVTTNTIQNGTAYYHSIPAKNQTKGAGLTEQAFVMTREFGDPAKYPTIARPEKMQGLYVRHILAKNGRFEKDEEFDIGGNGPEGEIPVRVAIHENDSPNIVEPLYLEDLLRAGGPRIRKLLQSPIIPPTHRQALAIRNSLEGTYSTL